MTTELTRIIYTVGPILLLAVQARAVNCCACFQDGEPVPLCIGGMMNQEYCEIVVSANYDNCVFHANSVCQAEAPGCEPDLLPPVPFPAGAWKDTITSTLYLDIDLEDDGTVDEENIPFSQTIDVIRLRSPYTNPSGFRQIDMEVVSWEAHGYSSIVGDIVLTLTDVPQPLSHVVAEQTDRDYPATITFNAIHDVTVDGVPVLTRVVGTGVGHGFAEIPPGTRDDLLLATKSWLIIEPFLARVDGGQCAFSLTSASTPLGTPIPTASEWGLISLTLLGLVVGTIVLGRRRRMKTVG